MHWQSSLPLHKKQNDRWKKHADCLPARIVKQYIVKWRTQAQCLSEFTAHQSTESREASPPPAAIRLGATRRWLPGPASAPEGPRRADGRNPSLLGPGPPPVSIRDSESPAPGLGVLGVGTRAGRRGPDSDGGRAALSRRTGGRPDNVRARGTHACTHSQTQPRNSTPTITPIPIHTAISPPTPTPPQRRRAPPQARNTRARAPRNNYCGTLLRHGPQQQRRGLTAAQARRAIAPPRAVLAPLGATRRMCVRACV